MSSGKSHNNTHNIYQSTHFMKTERNNRLYHIFSMERAKI